MNCSSIFFEEIEWRHFLSVKDFKDISVQTKIKNAQKFLEDKLPNKLSNEAGLFHSFPLNYPDLINNKFLKEKWPNLEEDLAFHADQVLGIFAQANLRQKHVTAKTSRSI